MSQTKVTDAVRDVTAVDAAKITTGTIPEARIATLDATKLTGTIHVDRLTNAPATDISQLEMNQALLAFKIAASNQLAKFQMVDQVIDEYQDATGIDEGNSTNELAGGATTAKYYEGGATVTPTVTGGDTDNVDPTDSDYWIHKFTSDGNFVTNTAMTVEWLVVAGGGSGAAPDYSGGGGAGGLRTSFGSTSGGGSAAEADASMSAATYAITVGDGGTAVTSGTNSADGQGHDSSIIGTGVSITSTGGGRANYTQHGSVGGSGGGAGREGAAANSTGGAGTANQGFRGGNTDASNGTGGAGGGGASAQGVDTVGNVATNGGAGLAVSITGASVTYAGGGGGAAHTGSHGSGGAGGGGDGTNTGTGHGTDGLGGGGGGTKSQVNTSSTGGSGVVIIRRPVSATTSGADLTLQSVATTAASAPTTGDLVVLMDDGGSGTSAVQTNIKGFISRNGNFATLDTDHKQVTFVDEGTWGTTKQKILVARNVDLSGITTGTSMKYRLTTHSQSAGTMETRIHATSLAWA